MSRASRTPVAVKAPETNQLSLYIPLDRFMVRTPLLPVAAYEALLDQPNSPDLTRPSLLRHPLLREPRVRRALAVGSLSLFEALDRPEHGDRDLAHREEKALRYLIRMSTRPTPYGLFAGVALGEWGERTDLALAQAPPRIRTRPDMEWLLRLVLPLEERPEIRRQLCLVANPAAFIWTGWISLAERAPGAGPWDGAPVSVRATRMALRAVELARTPIAYDALIEGLYEAAPNAPLEKIEDLITELWQQTLLLTDLRPPLTTEHPAQYVARRLARIAGAEQTLTQVRRLLDDAAAWDAAPAEESIATFRHLVADAKKAVATSDTPVQVDMAMHLQGLHVTRAVADEVVRAAELLLRMTPLPHGSTAIVAYTQAFVARYGHDRETPLLELLHPEAGIGPVNGYSAHGGIDQARAAARSQVLFDLACRALREGRPVIELDEATLAALETCSPRQAASPASLDLNVFVVADSANAVDAGDFLVVVGPNVGAQAACRGFGRFADLLGDDARALLDAAARAEETHHPDRLWAELVYLPHNVRSANVTIRPPVRNHELTLAVGAGVDSGRVIPLDELVVGVRQGSLYLRWPAADKEVMVCAGHMLNTNSAPAVCRFLSEIGNPGGAVLSMFNWAGGGGFPYLPRVQVGRVVLSLAQWHITTRTRQSDLSCKDPEQFRRAVQSWREMWGVPRHVYFSFGDNRLLLDLTVEGHVAILREELADLKDGGQILLQEALPGPQHAWVSGPGGSYMAEFVVPLVRRPLAAPPTAASGALPAANGAGTVRRAASPVPRVIRLRPLGSEWVFIKLYTPRSREEDFIAGPLWLFIEEVTAGGLAEEWFFIRYADPDPHLRLRFRGEPGRLLRDLVPRLSAWTADLVAGDWCVRSVFDTYDREVERYGGIGAIELAESVFAADSRASLDLLLISPTRLPSLDRTTLAILSVDDLLTSLGLSEEARFAWYQLYATAMWDSIGPAYRGRKTQLRSLLGDPALLTVEPGGAEVSAVFAARRAALAPLSRRLVEMDRRGELLQSRNEIYRSFVHMHCNRLLESAASHEASILGLLLRTWDGLRHAPRPISAVRAAANPAENAVREVAGARSW